MWTHVWPFPFLPRLYQFTMMLYKGSLHSSFYPQSTALWVPHFAYCTAVLQCVYWTFLTVLCVLYSVNIHCWVFTVFVQLCIHYTLCILYNGELYNEGLSHLIGATPVLMVFIHRSTFWKLFSTVYLIHIMSDNFFFKSRDLDFWIHIWPKMFQLLQTALFC